MTAWFDPPAKIARHSIADGGGIFVVRDDLLEGGSKMRFLPHLVEGAEEVVFGGPFCGGAPYALSVIGKRTGKTITLFYAKRNSLHPLQIGAQRNGAKLVLVPHGRMSNVQAKARAYAAAAGALFLPLGFDVPQAEEPFVASMERVRREIGSPPQVWCATGSGMLARCLGRAFPESEVIGVTVGLESRHGAQRFPSNVRLEPSGYDFSKHCAYPAPFPCHSNYDRKAWAKAHQRAKRGSLFWNVLF